MKRKMNLLFLSGELKEKLQTLSGVSAIETLKTELYPEKYLVRVTQEVDPLGKQAGTFKQRVVLCHIGFDRPTVLVTEGYGGAYALRETYQEELSKLLNANVIFVEYRYFLESKPDPLNWDYLTAENSAYDLHRITELFKQIYTGKWISTGISKGGQTTTLYRAYFPDDVDFSVPYVAPLNRGPWIRTRKPCSDTGWKSVIPRISRSDRIPSPSTYRQPANWDTMATTQSLLRNIFLSKAARAT